MKTIILCGEAGSGKSSAARGLIYRLRYQRVSIAEPLKILVQGLFQFGDEQVFGSSDERNAPDLRYPRGQGHDRTYLTPREALQRVGEAVRDCYENTWIDMARDRVRKLRTHGFSAVIDDARYENELLGFRADGALIVKIRRPGARLVGEAANHSSEAELRGLPDELFDAVIENTGTLVELCAAVECLANASGRP